VLAGLRGHVTFEVARDAALVVGELVANSVEHAEVGPAHYVRVDLQLLGRDVSWDARSRTDDSICASFQAPPRVQRVFDLAEAADILDFVPVNQAGEDSAIASSD
jgi:two-component sensor histidine kinase